MEGGKEAKRAEIESAMDAIIASSFLPSPPRAYLVASMTHRIEAAPGGGSGGGGHIRHAGSVDRPFLLCQLLLILIPSFSWGVSGDQLRCRSDSDGVVIMRVARSPALVGIGMSSKQLAPLSLQQALVTRRRLIQQRRFWPATLHFLVLAAVALSLLMLTSAELYLPTQKQIYMTIVIIYPSACVRCVRGFIFAETAAGETKRDKLED